jgi:3-hydroxyisobutyrate dehydrogenase-like beta-hydroxyacid dehydrogenase
MVVANVPGGMIDRREERRKTPDVSSTPLRVAFAGLGTMGLGMARNIARAGFALNLTSRTFEKAESIARDFNEAGFTAKAVRTPAEAALSADIIVSCVPDAPEVEKVHLGNMGTVNGARAGTIIIDCSTIAAEAARDIADELAEHDIKFLDAPVSGGQKGANEGTLSFFIGGKAEAFEKARPVFEAMGKRLTHLGPSGAGQLGKATNQVIVAGNLMAVCEGLAFAKKAGLPMEALHGALTSGAANSWALDVLGKKILERDFNPAFAIKHQQKDLAIVLKTARKKGVSLPGVALVHQLLAALEADGRSENGTQALMLLYEKLAGIAQE